MNKSKKIGKSRLLLVATMLTACFTPASHAEVIKVVADMSELTCEQLLEGGVNSTEAAIWLSGYYNGLRKNTKLDLGALMDNAKVVVDGCHSNPKKTVMQTIDAKISHK